MHWFIVVYNSFLFASVSTNRSFGQYKLQCTSGHVSLSIRYTRFQFFTSGKVCIKRVTTVKRITCTQRAYGELRIRKLLPYLRSIYNSTLSCLRLKYNSRSKYRLFDNRHTAIDIDNFLSDENVLVLSKDDVMCFIICQ